MRSLAALIGAEVIHRLCFDFEASKHVEVADMCDSQEAANQNGLCCLETLQECQNKNLSLYAASSYDGTSRKALFMEEPTKQNTCICSPDHLRISRMIKQLFSKSSSFFQSQRLVISPLKFKESS